MGGSDMCLLHAKALMDGISVFSIFSSCYGNCGSLCREGGATRLKELRTQSYHREGSYPGVLPGPTVDFV